MLRTIISCILLAVLFTGIFSCKKYPKGPSFTIFTKKARLEGSWVVESALLNDVDVTDSLYTSVNYVEVYDKDGNYSYTSKNGTGSGKWSFQSDGMNMKYTANGGGPSSKVAVILKLKLHQYWYYYTTSAGKLEIHLKPYK